MNRVNAERMLGPEGWKPTAKEAKEAGLVTEVVPHDQVGHQEIRCISGPNFMDSSLILQILEMLL